MSLTRGRIRVTLFLFLNEWSFPPQKLRVRLLVLWLWAALDAELPPQQLGACGRRYPVRLPEDLEGKAPARPERKSAKLWWVPGFAEAQEWGGLPLYFRERYHANDCHSVMKLKTIFSQVSAMLCWHPSLWVTLTVCCCLRPVGCCWKANS